MSRAIKQKAIRKDKGKPRMDLLSSEALLRVAEVMTAGLSKYEDHNWRKGMNWSRVISSAMRHLNAFNDGIDKDPETSLSHAAHAATNLMFLVEYEKTHRELDDRYKHGPTKRTIRSRVVKSRSKKANK